MEPAWGRAAFSGGDDSRAPEDSLPNPDEADDAAPEELGDSMHEAQNRGGLCRAGSEAHVTMLLTIIYLLVL
jgi:hypothetical protein